MGLKVHNNNNNNTKTVYCSVVRASNWFPKGCGFDSCWRMVFLVPHLCYWLNIDLAEYIYDNEA